MCFSRLRLEALCQGGHLEERPHPPPDTDAHIMACTVNGRTGRDRPGSGNRTRTVGLDTDSLPGALAKMAKGMRSRTSAVTDVKMV